MACTPVVQRNRQTGFGTQEDARDARGAAVSPEQERAQPEGGVRKVSSSSGALCADGGAAARREGAVVGDRERGWDGARGEEEDGAGGWRRTRDGTLAQTASAGSVTIVTLAI